MTMAGGLFLSSMLGHYSSSPFQDSGLVTRKPKKWGGGLSRHAAHLNIAPGAGHSFQENLISRNEKARNFCTAGCNQNLKTKNYIKNGSPVLGALSLSAVTLANQKADCKEQNYLENAL
jgi:hypothetical protein